MKIVVGKRTYTSLLIAAVVLCFLAVNPIAAQAMGGGGKGKGKSSVKDHTPTLVCHQDNGCGHFNPITVHAHSVQKHVDKHGDLFPGDTTDAGLILGDDCAEITCPCLTESTDGPTTIGEWVVGAHVYADNRPDPPEIEGACTSSEYSRLDGILGVDTSGYRFAAMPQADRWASCPTAAQSPAARGTCRCTSSFHNGIVGFGTGVNYLSDDELAACQAVLSAFQDEDDYALRVCGP